MDMNSLPVHYYKQASAWMDTTVFKSWFLNRYVPHVKKHSRGNDIEYSASNNGWQTPEKWLAEDANDPGYQTLSDNEKVRLKENDSENESDSDSEQQQPTISQLKLVKHFRLVYSGWNHRKKLSQLICYWLNSGKI